MTNATPLDCSTVISQLWDYLDGELDATRWESISAHLATCIGCASHVEFCRSFLKQVRATPMSAADIDALRARVLAVLHPS